MLSEKTIAVVIPAYNEETQIRQVLDTMPDFVDRMIVVNDCSMDTTAQVVQDYMAGQRPDAVELRCASYAVEERTPHNLADVIVQQHNRDEWQYFTPADVVNHKPHTERIILINHRNNAGVGAAIATGYKWCKDYGIDCAAVMAGDGQMDPAELESICRPVVDGEVEYVKGNRLRHPSARLVIPKVRLIGNAILSLVTSMCSGYWRMSDSQSGYTAISKNALNAIALHKIYPSYGMPNDMLVKLNIACCTIREIGIKPVYHVGEQSKMNEPKVFFHMYWLLITGFFQRLWVKHFFHPLFVFYHLGLLFFGASLPYLWKIVNLAIIQGQAVNPVTLLVFMFLLTNGTQAIIWGLWIDIQENERLYKR